MFEIVDVPDNFMDTGLISNYPPHQKTTNIEAKFFEFVKKTKSIESNLKYIPIQWTNYLVKNNKHGKHNLEKLVKEIVDSKNHYHFTVVQYDGGPLVEIDNCIIFSCGGMFNTKMGQNTSFIPIPLLSDTHNSTTGKKKKYLASFNGRNTHPIRQSLYDSLYGMDGFRINLSDKNSIGKFDERRFKKELNQSYFSICPRGYGPASFRFYESFDLGAVPVYVSDEFHLPFTELIDWNKLCILIKPNEIDTIPKKLNSLLGSNNYSEMIEYGRYCSEKYFTYQFTIEYIMKTITKMK